ncbi:hypothetical protein ACA910_018475 [Epithemia clementina (nom. ined.)]
MLDLSSNFSDDHSISSTVTVVDSNEPLSSLHCCSASIVADDHAPTSQRPQRPIILSQKKQVRFAEQDNEYSLNFSWIQEDCQQLWFSDSDYQYFKTNHIISAAKRIIRHDRHAARNNDTDCFGHVMDRLQKACCQVSHNGSDADEDQIACGTDFETLQRIYASSLVKGNNNDDDDDCFNRIGIEYYTVSSLAKDRKQRRQQLIQAVLDVQFNLVCLQQQQSHAIITQLEERIFQQARINVICATAQDISRPACLLAKAIAQAQL